MISESFRSRNPAGHAGLLQNLFALVNALAEFFESRFALLAEESKAARGAITDTDWLLSFRTTPLCPGLCFPNNWGRCGVSSSGWNFMAMDSARCRRAAFYHCAGATPDRMEPNHQAVFPRHFS